MMSTLENKTISVSERGLTSADWTEYNDGTKRTRYSTVPSSDITAETVVVDDFTLSQKDTAGITTTATRSFTASGMVTARTDGRGNVKTNSYETARGLLLGTTYSDGTTTRSYEYNYLGQLTQVTDAAGTRTFTYNDYAEPLTDSLAAGGVAHLITETRDAMGRSTGYTYAKNGTVQHTYTPYGSVTADGDAAQPIQWSSEFYDEEPGLVYYNFRHYSPITGRWLGRDPIPIITNTKLYTDANNSPVIQLDVRGLFISLSGCSIDSSQFTYQQKCPKGARKRQKGYLWLFDIKEACNNHDRCYGTCGKDRKKCDAGLFRDIYSICMNDGGWFLHEICLNLASLYSGVVLIAGSSFYEAGQDEGCEWQPCVE